MNKLMTKIGLHFEDPALENEYLNSMAKSQMRTLFILNTITIIATILNLIFFASPDIPEYFTIFRYCSLGTNIFFFVFSWKCQKLYKFLIILACIQTIFTYYYSTSVDYFPQRTVALFFSNAAFLEVIIVITLPNYGLRILIQIFCVVLGLVYKADANLVLSNFGFMIAWMLFENSYRNHYRMVVDSRNTMLQFKTLVTEDLPALILIINREMKLMSRNDLFKERIGKVENLSFIKLNNDYDKFEGPDLLEFLTKNSDEWSKLVKNTTDDQTSKNERKSYFGVNKIGGETHNYEIKFREITWDNENCLAIIMNDITEREKIVNLSKLSEYKDQVIATVSHELRTPINGILGMVNILIESEPMESQKQLLINCKSCANLLLNFVNSILDLHQIKARTFKINMNYFSLESLLEDVQMIYGFQAQRKKINFSIVRGYNLPKMIFSDRHRLVQIIINLLSNAFKFTPSEGRILLIMEVDKKSHNIIRFTVSDSGIGVKPEDLSKLFKRFSKIHQEDKEINTHGVGLGLMISNELVKSLNNTQDEFIRVESEYGKGTKFYFNLKCLYPELLPEESKIFSEVFEENLQANVTRKIDNYSFTSKFLNNQLSNDTEVSLLSLDSSRQFNCLIVDDNSYNILTFTFILQKMGYSVDSILSGKEAIKMALEKSYNIIFMDINMPIMDGYETCSILKRKMIEGIIEKSKIIAVTANNEGLNAKYEEAGFDGVIYKPIMEESMRDFMKKFSKYF